MAGRSIPLRDRLITTPASSVFLCSVVKSEMFYGAMKSQDPAKTLSEQREFLGQFQSFPFDDSAALHFGEIRADLSRMGMMIGPYDLQIAAIALANDLTLVTHNISEFARVANLKFEDWES